MDDEKNSESHLTSAAAFVEGGIQEACDDACSICLEAFCDSDPSTVTSCKHEFHLQCILEWCQRSSQCPMCWQSISLKDPTSQELLEAVEREKSFRFNQSRNTTIFHHPTLGDFELQHLAVGENDTELEERIIQHLAAAAAMGRAHHIARREGQRGRYSTQGRPQFLVFSAHPNAPAAGPVSTIPEHRGEQSDFLPTIAVNSTGPLTAVGEEPPLRIMASPPGQVDPVPVSETGPSMVTTNRLGISSNRNSAGQSSPASQDRAGPSEFQSFSESFKSRFNALSMRYKESISKSTKGWKEKLFARHASVADLSSEVKREVSAGIASVSRMVERLDTRETSSSNGASVSHGSEGSSTTELNNQSVGESLVNTLPNDTNALASCATVNSGPN